MPRERAKEGTACYGEWSGSGGQGQKDSSTGSQREAVKPGDPGGEGHPEE